MDKKKKIIIYIIVDIIIIWKTVLSLVFNWNNVS